MEPNQTKPKQHNKLPTTNLDFKVISNEESIFSSKSIQLLIMLILRLKLFAVLVAQISIASTFSW